MVFLSEGQSEIQLSHEYGELVIQEDGSYTFTLNEAGQAAQTALDDGESLSVNFADAYQVTDGVNPGNFADVTISVEGSNDIPEITVNPLADGNADVVYESGLPTGSDVAANSEYAYGTFSVSDADGLDDLESVTINGTTVALAALAGSSFAGEHGTLTVTNYNAETGVASYEYELTDTTTDVAGPEEDSFSLTVSDGTASSAPASIVIEIVDDVPTAQNDGDSTTEVSLYSELSNLADDHITRRSRGIHAAWHFWYAVSFGGESGVRKVGLCGTHPLTRRYVSSYN